MKKPINIRIDKNLLAEIDKKAKETYRTRTQYIIDAILKELRKWKNIM